MYDKFVVNSDQCKKNQIFWTGVCKVLFQGIKKKILETVECENFNQNPETC